MVTLAHPYGRGVTSLPDAARFALWFSAFVAGDASLDETRDAIVGTDAAHDVRNGSGDLEPLILALGRFRAAGAISAGVALPVPGDPLGLAGPPAFNATALEVEEAVLLPGLALGLLPSRVGSGVVWDAVPAETRRQVPDLSEVDTLLRHAVVAAAEALAALDVARWRPEVADKLMALRRPVDLRLPPGTSERVIRVLGLASRCRRVVQLALADDGGAVSAYDADRRRDALMPLDHAARRAVVAACSFPRER